MRALIAHNTYQHHGGEDSVVEAEAALLHQAGHDVSFYRRNNDEIIAMSPGAVAVGTLWSDRTRREISALAARFLLDTLHAHNTFPLISPSLYWAAAHAGVPVIQTLHNFRLLCPNALLLRDGRVCEACLGNVPWRGVLHGCYRNSRLQSTALASMLVVHRLLGTWRNKVTRYIALTEFARRKFIEGGLPADRIVVKPNFCQVQYSAQETREAKRQGALFVGRLSAEKGVASMLRAWEGLPVSLRIVGDGPIQEDVVSAANAYIVPVGRLDSGSVAKEMLNASFLVFPSEWYEGFPMTLVEAFSCGLPVIASRLGSMAEIVEDGVTGLHFTPGDSEDLAAKVRSLRDNPGLCRQMGYNARKEYEAKYTPERNYQLLMNIYQDAIDEQKDRNTTRRNYWFLR